MRPIIAISLLGLFSTNPLAGQTLTCKPADSLSSGFLESVKGLVRSTDPARIALRQSIGLGSATVSQVTPITSGQVCNRLAGAVNQLAQTPAANRSVYVVKVGTKHYFVWDPNATAGHHDVRYVFDSKYKLIKALLI